MTMTQADLEAYLQDKIGRHLGALTPEQLVALKKAIADGRHAHVKTVRKEFTRLADMNEEDRAKDALAATNKKKLETDLPHYLLLAETTIDSAGIKKRTALALCAAFDDIGKRDFIKQTPSGRLFLTWASSLRSRVEKLEKHTNALAEAANGLKVIRGTGKADRVDAAIDRADKEAERVRDAAASLTRELTECGHFAKSVILDQSTQAFVHAHPDEARKQLKQSKDLIQGSLSMGNMFVPPGFEWVGATANLATEASAAVANEVLERKQVKKFDSEHLEGAIFNHLKPEMIAKRLRDMHLQNLDIALAAVGVPASFADKTFGWPIISAVIRATAKGYFDATMAQAKRDLDRYWDLAKPPVENVKKLGKMAQKDLGLDDAVDGLVFTLQNLSELAASAKEVFKRNSLKFEEDAPGWDPAEVIAAIIVGPVVRPIVGKIVLKFSEHKAEFVSSEDLIRHLASMQDAAVPEHVTVVQAPVKQKVANAGVDEIVLSRRLVHDGREFEWVQRQDGNRGARYVDNGEFVSYDDEKAPPYDKDISAVDVPTVDSLGRRVRELIPRHAGNDAPPGHHFVRIGNITGKLDPDLVFTALQPHPDVLDDRWRTRTIDADHYAEPGGQPVRGRWYSAFNGRYYAFERTATPGDKHLEWAKYDSKSANSGGTLIGEIFNKRSLEPLPRDVNRLAD